MHHQACIAGAPPAWVVVVVGEERIFAGHDVSWSAASEVGIIVELERARSFIANF